MTPFILTRQAILQVIEGLVLELDKQQGLQLRIWQSDLVWEEDLNLSDELYGIESTHIQSILKSVSEFFGIETDELINISTAEPLSVWIDCIQSCLERRMHEFRFRPAGYVSDQDLCVHPVDSLFQQAAATASLLQGRRRLVLMVSPHSVIGFVVGVLVPCLLQIDVIDARKMSPDQLGDELAFGDVIVATPTLWAYLIRENIKVPDNSMGVSFGETMSLELAAQMRQNGIGVLRELYGSTQSGLVAWRDSPNDDFVLFDYWGKAQDEEAGLIRRYPDFQTKRVKPMDFFEWKNNRAFSLKGRRDGAAQIGAVNVFPDRIAKTLMKHKLVENCVVRIANAKGGANRLVANIYLSEKQLADYTTARDIDSWCRTYLSIHERPHILNFFPSS